MAGFQPEARILQQALELTIPPFLSRLKVPDSILKLPIDERFLQRGIYGGAIYIKEICAAIRAFEQGSGVIIRGTPDSGKTSLAHSIAQAMDHRVLHIDILEMGMTGKSFSEYLTKKIEKYFPEKREIFCQVLRENQEAPEEPIRDFLKTHLSNTILIIDEFALLGNNSFALAMRHSNMKTGWSYQHFDKLKLGLKKVLHSDQLKIITITYGPPSGEERNFFRSIEKDFIQLSTGTQPKEALESIVTNLFVNSKFKIAPEAIQMLCNASGNRVGEFTTTLGYIVSRCLACKQNKISRRLVSKISQELSSPSYFSKSYGERRSGKYFLNIQYRYVLYSANLCSNFWEDFPRNGFRPQTERDIDGLRYLSHSGYLKEVGDNFLPIGEIFTRYTERMKTDTSYLRLMSF
jgi:hypothetical protein